MSTVSDASRPSTSLPASQPSAVNLPPQSAATAADAFVVRRRKRIAGANSLPQINLNGIGNLLPRSTDSPSNSNRSLNSSSGLDGLPSKRLRQESNLSLPSAPSSSNLFEDQLNVEAGSGGQFGLSSSASVFPSKNRKGEKIVNNYRLFGRGPHDIQAANIENKDVKLCSILDADQYRKFLQLAERLNKAKKCWPYDDAAELANMIIPEGSQIFQDGGEVYLFVPFHHGSLHGYIQDKKGTLSEKDVHPLYYQLVRLVAFAHSLGILVRDLKLRKFVFSNRERTKLRLHSIVDMHVCENPADDLMADNHGCPAYVSPEILQFVNNSSTPYHGMPVDVWGLGILLYVMVCYKYPFYDSTPQGLFQKIRKGEVTFPPNASISPIVKTLICGILQTDANKRPSAQMLLHLPWVNRSRYYNEPLRECPTVPLTPNPAPRAYVEPEPSAIASRLVVSRSFLTNLLMFHTPSELHNAMTKLAMLQGPELQTEDEDQLIPTMLVMSDSARRERLKAFYKAVRFPETDGLVNKTASDWTLQSIMTSGTMTIVQSFEEGADGRPLHMLERFEAVLRKFSVLRYR